MFTLDLFLSKVLLIKYVLTRLVNFKLIFLLGCLLYDDKFKLALIILINIKKIIIRKLLYIYS